MKKKKKAEDMTANGSCQTCDEEYVMTPDHPQWHEFYERLSGPEGCNMKVHPTKGLTFKCKGGEDRSMATKILRDMGADVEASLDYFSDNGGFCDCEIIFNVDRGW
jgi:hypothetical protein